MNTNTLEHGYTVFRPINTPKQEAISRPTVNRNYRSYLYDRSIISSIYNKIAIEISNYDIRHIKLDAKNNYQVVLNSKLNELLCGMANIDQTGRSLLQDAVLTMFDKGHVAIVPVELDKSPTDNESYEILELRVGHVVYWYPDKVKVKVYDYTAMTEKEVIMNKRDVSIIYNPFYEIMNDYNSLASRISRKLTILDQLDDLSVSGKLDIIISLPYMLKGSIKKAQAEERKSMIEDQLRNSKYGIAYIDSTEKITQLNRPAENNILEQIKHLTSMLYSQLNMSESIFNGTASAEEKLSFYNNTIRPVLVALSEGMTYKFLSKTARTQQQRIWYIPNPFKDVPISSLGSFIDQLSRNEHISTNEIRPLLGLPVLTDSKYYLPRNPNMPNNPEPVAQQNQNGGQNL